MVIETDFSFILNRVNHICARMMAGTSPEEPVFIEKELAPW